MSELFKNSQMRETCRLQFAELFSLLYIYLASYVGTTAPISLTHGSYLKRDRSTFSFSKDTYKPDPVSMCLKCITTFLTCAGYHSVAESLRTDKEQPMNMNHFVTAVPSLVMNVISTVPNDLAWLVACLTPYSRSELESQRVATALFLASILDCLPGNHGVLTENILEMLLAMQSDRSCMVRQAGLRGLGFAIDNLPWELVSRNCNGMLSSFMQGLDYHNAGYVCDKESKCLTRVK